MQYLYAQLGFSVIRFAKYHRNDSCVETFWTNFVNGQTARPTDMQTIELTDILSVGIMKNVISEL